MNHKKDIPVYDWYQNREMTLKCTIKKKKRKEY